MTLELTPPAVSSDGNLTVWIVPKSAITDPSKPDLSALGDALRVTYSMTTDGYQRTTTQETQTDPRLTLAEVPELPGSVSNSLEVTYVHGHDDDVMDPLVTEREEVYVVERRAVPNEQAVAAGDIVDVIAGIWGKPRKNAPTTNGNFTKTAKLFVRSITEDVALV